MFSLSTFEIDAIILSIQVAVTAVAFSLPIGIAMAWLLVRFEFPGKIVLDALIHLPMVLPPVVVGYVLLMLLGRHGPVGAFLYENVGITIAFTWQGAALAAAVMAFPLMVRAIRLSMASVDGGLYAAARTLGAGPYRVFFTVTLPLAAPGILTGIILAFARSLGEFGATIAFVSNIPGETQTIPLALYSLINTPGGDDGALRLVFAAVFLSLIALVSSEVLARRFVGRKSGFA